MPIGHKGATKSPLTIYLPTLYPEEFSMLGTKGLNIFSLSYVQEGYNGQYKCEQECVLMATAVFCQSRAGC